MLKITGEEARDLLVALEYRGAEKWSDAKVQDTIEGLADAKDNDDIDASALKSPQKKLLQKVIDAIDEEEDIEVADATDADDSGEGDDNDDDDDPEEDDDDDDDDGSKSRPAARTPTEKATVAEEFVGTTHLIAALTTLCGLVEQLILAIKGNGDVKVLERPHNNGEGADDSLKAVIAAIRKHMRITSAESPTTRKELLAEMQRLFPKWTRTDLQKRIDSQLDSRMGREGIEVKNGKGGKVWVEE
jgi:hypothetical protein